jgi:hypothetical protein
VAIFRSFDDLAKGFAGAAKELNGEKLRKIAGEVGREAKKIANEEAAADLGGDNTFSGWPRNPLTTRYDDLATPGQISFRPASKRSAGAWTVANDGRNRGNAGGFSGPGINTATGLTARTKTGKLRKVRERKAKRWNGYTDGKGTADRVVDRVEKAAPKLIDDAVKKALRKHFD